jgi:signal transduction histidine kinase
MTVASRSAMPLSRLLAIRMIAVSLSLSLLLTAAFFIYYFSNTARLREATLTRNIDAIAAALNAGINPATLPLYRNHPGAYGFRVFDRRALATRHILAEAYTRYLPPVQHLEANAGDDGDKDKDAFAVGSDLYDGFQRFSPHGGQLPKGHVVSLLIHRVMLAGHKYWIQADMIGDPAWIGLDVIAAELFRHVFFPLLLIVPALTLAMFVATRDALRPLRRLSIEAGEIASAVASGQPMTPVSNRGMAREFAEVAAATNAMLAKLENSLQLQKQFASDAAHELRTPLAVLLLEVSQLPPGAARDRIKADLEELGSLVGELLRFAQAEDVLTRERTEVDLVAAARKVCEEAVPQAITARHMIEFSAAPEPLIVLGNATLIEIAIRNLVENAIKYSPADTTVSVSVEAGPRIIVDDQGPGIPRAQQDVAFDRYWRADHRQGNGTGVGLALTRRIAQLHDGQILIESRPRGGTRMVLSFARGRKRRVQSNANADYKGFATSFSQD